MSARDWFVEQRLLFVDWALLNRGSIGRTDIVETFRVSPPMATKDLAMFGREHPGVMTYDAETRRHVASDRYQPVRGARRGPLVVTIAMPAGAEAAE